MEVEERIEIKKGLMFKSFKDVENFVEQFKTKDGYIFVKGRGAKMLKSQYKKEKIISKQINENLVYYQLPYECQFGKERKTLSRGIRQTRFVKLNLNITLQKQWNTPKLICNNGLLFNSCRSSV